MADTRQKLVGEAALTAIASAIKSDIDNKADAQATTEALATKADTASVNEALTTKASETEVSDIRVGANGKTYPSAGDAIRGQFDNVNDELVKLVPQNIANNINWTSNKRINYTDGTVERSESLSASDYLDIENYNKIIYSRYASTTTSSATTVGMAFYDSEKVYISGQRVIIRSPSSSWALQEIDVPATAKYARFSWSTSLPDPFVVYDYNQYNNAFSVVTESNAANVDKLDSHSRKDISYNWTLGKTISAQGIIQNAAGTAMSDYYAIDVPLYRGGALLDGDGDPLNAKVIQYNNGVFINRVDLNVLDEAFVYDPSCTHYRITVGYASALGKTITQEIVDEYFKTYSLMIADYVLTDIKKLKEIYPNYTGKKLSILGDSISTFVPSADKVIIDDEGYAPEGCLTNYPGNRVRYAYSDINTVAATWWGIVMDKLGLVLGINESYAGSMISWNGVTENQKYGANKCFASDYRIGHLGENGTPDVIIIYGGTNDVNHYKGENIPIGSLNTVDDPMNYDSYPKGTTTFYDAFTTTILKIQHSYPDAVLLCVLPFFVTDNYATTTPYDLKLINDAMIDVCNYLGVEYVDLRKIINLYDISSLLIDDLHPNAIGMSMIAKAILHKLNNML